MPGEEYEPELLLEKPPSLRELLVDEVEELLPTLLEDDGADPPPPPRLWLQPVAANANIDSATAAYLSRLFMAPPR